MSFQLTSNHINQLIPNSQFKDKIQNAINEVISYYDIDHAPRRVRYFVSQCYFETQSFTKWVENLNYSTPERLCNVWPTRFSLNKNQNKAYAPDYINNPEKLGNLVYANRNGNGNAASGDGYKYRGRGAFHLTFKNNYKNYSSKRYNDLTRVENPELVENFLDAFMSAGWFWEINNLSKNADNDEFTLTTKIINGSGITVPQRLEILKKINSILQW
jgi:putative chitinase